MQLEPLGDASSPQDLRLAPAEEKEMEPVRKKEEEKTHSRKSLNPACTVLPSWMLLWERVI